MALCTGMLEWLRGFSSHPYIKINHGYGICKEKGIKLFYFSWVKFVMKQPRRVAPSLAAEARSAEAASLFIYLSRGCYYYCYHLLSCSLGQLLTCSLAHLLTCSLAHLLNLLADWLLGHRGVPYPCYLCILYYPPFFFCVCVCVCAVKGGCWVTEG